MGVYIYMCIFYNFVIIKYYGNIASGFALLDGGVSLQSLHYGAHTHRQVPLETAATTIRCGWILNNT